MAHEILIVEDSPTQTELLRHLLESQGYDVRTAADGEQALAALAERLPSLVVTDVVMPGMSGYDLCERIKGDSDLGDVPVILLTSLSEPQDVIRSLQCRADNFIRKPYEQRYLLSRISHILTSRELRRSGQMQVGLEVYLGGERHFIDADRQQILDFLLSTYDEVAQVNEELVAKNAELEARHAELERALAELGAERRRAEELASLNRAVLDATEEGIALVDDHGRKLLCNTALHRIAALVPGASPEAAVAENVSALEPYVAEPEALRAFRDAVVGGSDAEISFEIELTGGRGCLNLFSVPVQGAGGERIGRIVVMRDVSRQREIERLKSELVATVSHELRTPLASVLGFAELLSAADVDEQARAEYAGWILREARRLSDLVDDFLDLHRIEEGGFALAHDRVDLAELVREQAEVYGAQSACHSVQARLPDEPLPVEGERERLAQVLANLLSNAVKYSPKGGAVEVSASADDGTVAVSVRDHGLGIPTAAHDRLFTKFFRVDSSDTRSIGGTGLGLALCRKIVEAHGGEIGFESQEGEGSRFWFRLPRANAADRGRAGPPQTGDTPAPGAA